MFSLSLSLSSLPSLFVPLPPSLLTSSLHPLGPMLSPVYLCSNHALVLCSGLVSHAALVANSIRACDVDAQPSLWSNIILSGGPTTMKGYSERMQQDLAAVAPPVRCVLWWLLNAIA